MKKDILKAQIIETLEAITEQTLFIANHRGEIPQIEIDLVKKNILELYQNFHFLDKINNVNILKIIEDIDATERTDNPEEKLETSIASVENSEKEIEEVLEKEETPSLEAEEKIKEKVAEIENVEKIIPTEEKSNTESNIKEETNTTQTKENIIPEIKTIENKVEDFAPSLFDEPEDSKPKTSQESKKQTNTSNPQSTISDKFKSEKKSIHDIIEQNGDTSIASKLQKAPINDLIKAIGLNDRFFLTKELFKNNSEKYNEAIKILNEMPNLDEAFDYLDDLKTKLEWDENSSACLKIYDLIRRKHQNKK